MIRRLEVNNSYKFALMPNINANFNIEKLSFKYDSEKNKSDSYTFFMYVLYNGNLEVLKFGISLKRLIDSFLKEHYSNSNGYLIQNNQTKFQYFLNHYYMDYKEEILVTHDYNKDSYFRIMRDIIYNSPLDLFNPTLGLFLEFDVIESEFNKKFYKIVRSKITEGKPIFKKDESYKYLYESIPTLEKIKEIHFKNLSKILNNIELCE